MAELRESIRERDLALLLDVSSAANSSRACQMADEFINQLPVQPLGTTVDLNAGDLLLTKSILLKIKQQLEQSGALLGTVYSSVPQTQQAALDEGFFVKGKLKVEWTPLRTPLPGKSNPSSTVTGKPHAARPSASAGVGVELPNFSKSPSFELQTAETAKPSVPVVDTTVTKEELPAKEPEPTPLVLDFPDTAFETLFLRQTLRSGQLVRFNGNVVILGDVHAGSEITAGGDIVVWGELRGIAHAGAQGNYKAEIRAMRIEALQLRIADYIARRPDRIYYHKEANNEASVVTPELAKVTDGEIKIFKTTISKT